MSDTVAGEPESAPAPNHAASGADTVTTLREAVVAFGIELASDFLAGAPAQRLVGERAAFVDGVLLEAWRHCGLADERDIALAAVGGYGRAELHPASDIDILVVLRDEPDSKLREQLRALVTMLWDVRLEIGHSVRTVAECAEQAAGDITIATSLMESRLLAGSTELFDAMQTATDREHVWPSREFFEAKSREQTARHHKFHDTAYNLEPNVKEGPGGLRDIQMVGWVAKRHFGAQHLHELVDHEFLTEGEFDSLTAGQDFLWQVRFALHVLTGRREDRLLFNHQRTLAEQFGFCDDDANLAVEQFMKRYYRTIMELSRLNEMLLELFEEAILLGDDAQALVKIDRHFQTVNGFLEVTSPEVFRRHPFALLGLFLVLQQHADIRGVRASTIRLVRDHRHLIDDAFRRDIRARSLFLEILRQPRGVTHELHRMHRYGVLGRYLPVFGAIEGQMQYDLFHAYTVDEHTLRVVGNLRAFTVPEGRVELPDCAEVFDRLPKPELLHIAGLFHDIAKGRGGDHSTLGAEEAARFCFDHGLGTYDARVVSWLVRHHLTMSMTAQRRDITDPEVISAFATEVGDQAHLDYLYLLTVGDIRGTNPQLWNDWKATLLRDLYTATSRALRRGLENPVDRAELIQETKTDARRRLGARADGPDSVWERLGEDYFLRSTADEIAWHTGAILEASGEDLPLVLVRVGRGGTEIFVYAPDQEFLFAALTSALGGLGLDIHDARIITGDNGMTLDTFVVLDLEGGTIRDPSQLRAIAARVREALDAPANMRPTTRRRSRRQLRHFTTPTEVAFTQDPANSRTLMEVIAADHPGLLARIGWSLADARVRLQTAKIATIGERAEDVFFVTDSKNHALEPGRFATIRDAVAAAVDADGVGAPTG